MTKHTQMTDMNKYRIKIVIYDPDDEDNGVFTDEPFFSGEEEDVRQMYRTIAKFNKQQALKEESENDL